MNLKINKKNKNESENKFKDKFKSEIFFILLIIIAISSLYFFLNKNLIIQSYDETDTKYYYNFFSNDQLTLNPNVLSTANFIFKLANIKSFFDFSTFIKILTLVGFILINLLSYYIIKNRRIFLIFLIMSLSFYVTNYFMLIHKFIYIQVMINVLISKIILDKINFNYLDNKNKNTNNRNIILRNLIFSIIFLIHNFFSAYPRPEYFLFFIPIFIDFLLKNSILTLNFLKIKKRFKSIFLIICLALILLSFLPSIQYSINMSNRESGRNYKNTSALIKNNLNLENLFIVLVYLLFFLFFKETRFYTIYYLFLQILFELSGFEREIVLYLFYMLYTIPIIISKINFENNDQKKYESKKAMSLFYILIFLIIINIIFFKGSYPKESHFRGNTEYKLLNKFKDTPINIYTRYDKLYFGFLFYNTNVSLFGIGSDFTTNLRSEKLFVSFYDYNKSFFNIYDSEFHENSKIAVIYDNNTYYKLVEMGFNFSSK